MKTSDWLKASAYVDSIADAIAGLEETAAGDAASEILDALKTADMALWGLVDEIKDTQLGEHKHPRQVRD